MKNRYCFINPGKVKIIVRTLDQNPYADISTDIWRWEDGGIDHVINWTKFRFHPQLVEILKGFICTRLEIMAPQTVSSQDKPMLRLLSLSSLRTFPWQPESVIDFLNKLPSQQGYSSFTVFYQWCLDRSIEGFLPDLFLQIKTLRTFKGSSYDHILLQQYILTSRDEIKILKYLEESYQLHDFGALQENVILHLGFELAPRPIQIHTLNIEDLEIFKSEGSDEQYFTIWLPMAKKIRASLPEKKPRNISKILGNKILRLIEQRANTSTSSSALFIDLQNEVRMPANRISKLVTHQLQSIGFKKGEGLTLLRHHLGQSLANQGASAESIAEILGHNSTIAGRAYVTATPEISTIKAKALGKNGTYLDIMAMLLTGEFIAKPRVAKNRWVKGMVGSQYITGIGACGLNASTPCPKNPIYSCYTCSKFHPFEDGTHEEVKEALQKHAQFFVTTSESAMETETNRAVVQLEETIEAVQSVIERCKR